MSMREHERGMLRHRGSDHDRDCCVGLLGIAGLQAKMHLTETEGLSACARDDGVSPTHQRSISDKSQERDGVRYRSAAW